MARVTITEQGRDGRVRYTDDVHTLEGYFEFGGGDVITIISMGDAQAWTKAHPQLVGARADILRFVAAETIRQRAPGCSAEIDEATGVILLRLAPQRAAAPAPPAAAQRTQARAFLARRRALQVWAAVAVLAVAVIGGALFWLGRAAVMAPQGAGSPLNETVRFAAADGAEGLATLIQTTDPHPPRWSGRGGDDTASVSVLILALDGAPPRQVRLAKGLTPGAYSLARIFGSDGVTLWLDVAGLQGVRLADFTPITPDDLRDANPGFDPSWWEDPRGMEMIDGKLHIRRRDRSAAIEVDPVSLAATPIAPRSGAARISRITPQDFLAKGFVSAPGAWLGLHRSEDLAAAFKRGRVVKPVEDADEGALSVRRLYAGEVEAAANGALSRLRAITPLGEAEFFNAAFLRSAAASAPLRPPGPPGAIILHERQAALRGALMVSRVDERGRLLWQVETQIFRPALRQILPGATAVAFVGERAPVAGKVSEPVLVIVDLATGAAERHSLWR